MSCETCSCELSQGNAGTTSLSAQTDLFASLQIGMHALAQPMTLLRSYFYLAGHGAEGNVSQPLLADATSAIDDLCTLFRLMQELLLAQSTFAHVSAVPFSSVLDAFSETAEVILAGTGLRFVLKHDAEGFLSSGASDHAFTPTVSIDLERMRQAFRSMLHIVRGFAKTNSTLFSSFTTDGRSVTLRIEPEQPAGASPTELFTESAHLHLALVEANMRGQRATFHLAPKSFALLVNFSLAVGPA